MLRFFILCLMVLPVYGCESIQVTRYLEARYCPDALLLKGAERLASRRDKKLIMRADLAFLNASCDVDIKGKNIDDPKFGVTDIDLGVIFHGEVKSGAASSFELPLFMVLLRVKDQRVIWRQNASVRASRGRFTHQIDLTFPKAHTLNKAEYVLLGGFIVSSAQIDDNLKPYISQQKKESKPQKGN